MLAALRCCSNDGYNSKLAHFWKKYLKPLLEMLFELPWRQIVPFEGWEERRKRFLKKSSQEHFQESCVFVLIAFSEGC